MENEFSFAKKISFKPLLTSFFFGVMVAIIVHVIFPQNLLLWILCGIGAFLIESLLVYPLSLAKEYGFWKIDSQGIHYDDYSTWNKQVQAIYLPLLKKTTYLSLSDIKDFAVTTGEDILNSEEPDGGQLQMPLNRKAHYLVVHTKTSQKLILDLSWNTLGTGVSDTEIDQTIELLNAKF